MVFGDLHLNLSADLISQISLAPLQAEFDFDGEFQYLLTGLPAKAINVSEFGLMRLCEVYAGHALIINS